MIEFYPQVKAVHVAVAIASGLYFTLRGAGVLAGQRWPLAWPARWVAYTIDTTLLTAALMLLSMLPWALFANGWLAVKVVLLVVYVVLGYRALRARGRLSRRLAWYAAALLVYAWIYSIARAHHPLGALQQLV